jgi:PAS domain S-box-containing protein
MRLRTKILVGSFVMVLITALFSVAAIRYYANVTRFYEDISNRYYRTVSIAQELNFRTLERQASLQGFLLTGKTRYLVTYDENILPVKSLMQQARQLHEHDERYLRILREYGDLLTRWEATIAEAEKEMRQKLDYGVIDYGQYSVSVADTDRLGRKILRGLKAAEAELIRTAESDMADKSREAREVARSVKAMLIALALAGLGAGIAFGVLLSKRITTGLNDLVKAAEKISGGDLSYRAPVRNSDELGTLGKAFNHMVERLETTVHTLRESEEKYASVVEKANDGIIIIQDARFTFVNEKFAHIAGYPIDALVGMGFLEILPPETLESVKKRHDQRMDGKEVPSIYETKIVTKTGDMRDVELNAGLIEYKGRNADLVIVRDITDRKQHEHDLKTLSEQLINAQEEERKRISRELHDEIGQALSAININLEVLKNLQQSPNAVVQRRFRDLKSLVEKSIDDVHRISYDLRPYLLDDFGLVSTLRWYTETFGERTGIAVKLSTDGDEQGLSAGVETLIYRVTQEALTNVSKHAEAENVDILLEYRPRSVTLTVEDDGKGFEQSSCVAPEECEGRGLGLFGMRERVVVYGGELSIESESGRGCKLRVQVPLL